MKDDLKKIQEKFKSNGKVVFPKVRLIQDHILTTTFSEKVTPSGLIVSADKEGRIYDRQLVVAAGPNSVAQVGEEVEINPARFPRGNSKDHPAKNDIGPDRVFVVPPIEEIDGVRYLLISTREVKWIYKNS